jgi:hypothetical protein
MLLNDEGTTSQPQIQVSQTALNQGGKFAMQGKAV